MLNEDQYIERTPDLIAKVRQMRKAAERQMDRFTCVDDYDLRRVVGQGPKAAPVSSKTPALSSAPKHTKKGAARSATNQTSMDFPTAPAERGAKSEDV
ncbi:MAG: hypothetical protein WB439_14270 [Acidobacteriaceae bacterium]